ncbi:MFS general substrate transporter [Artomyces pyxidatus]|uniref:MFS general substrate transporter n=1 Tax=Artomyces pyxidatus TaxID=48021 RepID=A0ACB8SLD2_9AGAM|nr:MFS general substrate transporter [Artomyces pyxidatus]
MSSSRNEDHTFSNDVKTDSSSLAHNVDVEKNHAPPVVNVQSPVMDGGIHAWLTLVGAMLTTFCTFGYTYAFGVFQDYYTRSHAASASRISWIGSTQLCLLIAMGLPAGKLLDMGYFRQTVFAGSCLYVFSLFMVSIAHPDKYYQIFLSQGVGMGIGAGLLYIPAMAVQAHHWRARRALAMGAVITGSSIGGIVFPIMLNQLFSSSVGFAWGVRASAFMVLGCLVAANFLMTPRAAVTSGKGPKPNIKSLLLDIPYLLAIVGGLVCFMGIFFPYFYLQLFSVLNGVDTNLAFYTISIMNAGSIPGRTLPNLFAGRYGVFNTCIITGSCCGVLILALFGIGSTAGAIVFAILYGFFSGAFMSILSPVLASLARNESEMGIRLGLAFFFSAIGALAGQPIVGSLLGPTFSWFKAIIFSAVTTFAGISFTIASRQLLVRRKGTQIL